MARILPGELGSTGDTPAARSPTGFRLANFGYLGHTRELYAVWTCVPVFLLQSFTHSGMEWTERLASLAAFAVIAAGGGEA